MAIKKQRKKLKVGDNMFSGSGVNGETLYDKFSLERKDSPSISKLKKMINNDGQVQMLYNSIVNTILSSGWEIQDDPQIPAGEVSEEKEFLDGMFDTPWYAGGMRSSVDLTNRRMMRAILEGYRVFEVIWALKDETIHLHDLAPRSIVGNGGLTLETDDGGNFIGFKQRTYFNRQFVDAKVINEPGMPCKVVKATVGPEFGSLHGRSMFTAAYYHYDNAHKGMYLNHVGHELGAIKFRRLESKLNEAKTQELVDILERVGMETVVSYHPDHAEVFFDSVSDAQVMGVGKDMINLHYSMISKSLMLQFLDLGSNISDTGSRALGDTHMSFFKSGLETVGEMVIEETWNPVLYDLITVNFNNGIYPRMKVKPITDEIANTLLTLFVEIAKKGEIPDSLKAQVLSKGAKELEIETQVEDLLANMPQKKETTIPVENMFKSSGVKFSEDFETESTESTEIVRDLYPDEIKIRFSDIKRELESTEDKALRSLDSRLRQMKGGIVNAYVEAGRKGLSGIKRVKVKLADAKSYSQELYRLAFDIYNFGKVEAANELNAKPKETPKRIKDQILADLEFVVEEQESRLNLRLSKIANDALRNSIAENQAKVILDKEYDDFFAKVLKPTVQATIPEHLNKGRQETFDVNSKEIFAFRYSAVMDDRTTDYCRKLDGKVFQKSDPQFAFRTPPQHYGCRSIWSAVTNKEAEENNIVVTGVPAELPTFSSISSFKDIN